MPVVPIFTDGFSIAGWGDPVTGLYTWTVPLPDDIRLGGAVVFVGFGTHTNYNADEVVVDGRLTHKLTTPPNNHRGGVWAGTLTSREDLVFVYDTNVELNNYISGAVVVFNAAYDPTRNITFEDMDGGRTLTVPALPEGPPGSGGAVGILASIDPGAGWVPPAPWMVAEHRPNNWASLLDYTDQRVTSTGDGSFTGAGFYGARGVVIGLGPALMVAPPGRLFPRDDGLGVGGGRIFPPPSSQQRSGRQFGYY